MTIDNLFFDNDGRSAVVVNGTRVGEVVALTFYDNRLPYTSVNPDLFEIYTVAIELEYVSKFDYNWMLARRGMAFAQCAPHNIMKTIEKMTGVKRD